MAKKEQTWEYYCFFLFNRRKIFRFTLTDHWQEKHPELSREFVAELFLKLAGEENIEPTKYKGKREVYKWETVHQGQRYRFIFWFRDGFGNQLWVRNCYPIN